MIFPNFDKLNNWILYIKSEKVELKLVFILNKKICLNSLLWVYFLWNSFLKKSSFIKNDWWKITKCLGKNLRIRNEKTKKHFFFLFLRYFLETICTCFSKKIKNTCGRVEKAYYNCKKKKKWFKWEWPNCRRAPLELWNGCFLSTCTTRVKMQCNCFIYINTAYNHLWSNC